MRRQYIEQLKKGLTEIALLYLINEVQTYGYNLIKELERRTTGYFRFKGGTIYPALRRLELKGLIKSRWQRTARRHSRKYYRITEQGRRLLADRLAEWREFSSTLSTLMGLSNTGKAVSPDTA